MLVTLFLINKYLFFKLCISHSFSVTMAPNFHLLLNLQVEARTMEAPPEGMVDVFTTVDGSKEVQLKWLAPSKPNGKLTYTVLVSGLFYADQGIIFPL